MSYKKTILFVSMMIFIFTTGPIGSAKAMMIALPQNPNKNLSLGASGEEVSKLQYFLTYKGFLDSQYQTGYFGQKTKTALKEYQKSLGLPSTGFLGSLTRAQIKKAVDSIPPVTFEYGDIDKGAWSGDNYFTFTIKDGKLHAQGCNIINGSVTIDKVNHTIKSSGPLMSTLMACEQAKMDMDSKFTTLLDAGATYSGGTGHLIIESGQNKMEFFQPIP